MLEIACREAVFHFNKGHLTDPTIPMWVIKTKGKSYYIHHLDCSVPWSTKETPDNPSTKGSIKFKDCLLTIDDDNAASIAPLTEADRTRLKRQEAGLVRVITTNANLAKTLDNMEIDHSAVVTIGSYCSTSYYLCDVNNEGFTAAALAIPSLRECMPNEVKYQEYDSALAKGLTYYDEDADYEDDTDSEE